MSEPAAFLPSDLGPSRCDIELAEVKIIKKFHFAYKTSAFGRVAKRMGASVGKISTLEDQRLESQREPVTLHYG